MKNFMKNFFMSAVVIMVLLLFPAIGETIQHNYSQICEVYMVTDSDTIFIDPVGDLWSVTDTNYKKGETVEIQFHDNFTDYTREDDIIKKVKRVD